MLYVLLYVTLCPFQYCNHLDGKRELVTLLNVSSWCLVVVERLFLAVPWGCLRFVIVVFPDHTHLLFLAFFFSQFYCRYYDLISKLHVGLKSLLYQEFRSQCSMAT